MQANSSGDNKYYDIGRILKKRRWFVEALFNLNENATWERLVMFLLGLLLSGIWVDYLYALVTISDNQPSPPVGGILLISIIILTFIELIARNYLKRTTRQYTVTDAEVAPASKWVITLVSPWDGENDFKKVKITGPDFITGSNLENIAALIRHHQEKLEKVFLIGTFNQPGVSNAFNYLKDELRNPIHTPILKGTQFDPDKLLVQIKLEEIVQALGQRRDEKNMVLTTTADGCFEAVAYIIKKYLQISQVSLSDIAVDVTAGSKPMTVGICLAALAYGLKLTYRSSPRLISGLPVETLEHKKFVKVEAGVKLAQVVYIEDVYSFHPDRDNL